MNVRPFEGRVPELGQRVYVDPRALLVGAVAAGDDASFWPFTVARGDVNEIVVGARTNVQDNSVLHVTHDGPFSRGGYSRAGTQAADHDFKAEANLTPAGVFEPASNELDLTFTRGKVTADLIADVIEGWWDRHRGQLAGKRRLLLDLDNGPENQSRRSQFLLRMILLAQRERITVELCYYPPYHSKYNPIERCWSALEQKWGGALLNSLKVILQQARRMSWMKRHPQVKRLQGDYAEGVRLSKKEMKPYEARLLRSKTLPKYDITIKPLASGR